MGKSYLPPKTHSTKKQEDFSVLDFIVSGLAVYRATRLLTRDEITSPIRDKVWEKNPPEKSKIGYLFTCEWCMSVWVSSILQICRIISPRTTSKVEKILAFSAIAGMLTAHEDK